MHSWPSRRKRRFGRPLPIFLLAFVGFYFSVESAARPQENPVSFAGEILPLFKEKCFQCHGERLQMSDLDLRTREGALKGGANGPALVPGDPAASRLYRRVAGLEEPAMPFGSGLSEVEVKLLRRWIVQGAPWDLEMELDSAAREEVPEGITEEDRQWWSFKKPVRHPVPDVKNSRWSKNPVDAFLMSAMQEKGLRPAPPAKKETLVRRVYLDLTGLLPTPEEVRAFLDDDSPQAFERLVDRLLESPHYGERWGRHWLDVARYADSGGYEHDYDYPNAWRYRDYVIRAFNEDKPYDQFILEQLAGDELEQVTYESLIATGFNRVGATVGFREKDNPQYRYMYLDDMIATTSRGFMGLSVQCARCHDHKFDPILQMDYYRMMAIFFPYVKYDHPLVSDEEAAQYRARKAVIERRTEPLKARITEIEEPYRKLAFEKKLATFPEEIQAAVRTPESERTSGQQLLADQILSIRVGPVDDLLSPEDRAEIERLREEIEQIEKGLPEPIPVAMGMRDGDYRFAPDGPGDEVVPGKGDREFYDFEGSFLPEPGKPYVPPPAHFLPTGDYRNKGPVVEPGFLQVLTRGNPPTERPPSNGRISTGRRRALAEWLISKQHPLTARVMVNRIWQHHFARGIVSTPSNFGRTGQPPSHPELLDWLATEFVRQGWSIKQMHRVMLNSQAYQMASNYHSRENLRIDPQNVFLWRYRQHRLEGEIIRDMILAAGGKLNLERGGEPFFPPIPEKVRESFTKGKWEMMQAGPAVWRRSVYSYWKRGLRYPFFDVFDLPNLNVSCERRTITTVPTQALTLLNNEFVLQQARYFAQRVLAETESDPGALTRRIYWIALSREPRPEELKKNVAFFERQRRYHVEEAFSNPDLEALTDLCHVVLNLNEFVYMN